MMTKEEMVKRVKAREEMVKRMTTTLTIRMKEKDDLPSMRVKARCLPLQSNSHPPTDPSLIAAKHPSLLIGPCCLWGLIYGWWCQIVANFATNVSGAV